MVETLSEPILLTEIEADHSAPPQEEVSPLYDISGAAPLTEFDKEQQDPTCVQMKSVQFQKCVIWTNCVNSWVVCTCITIKYASCIIDNREICN